MLSIYFCYSAIISLWKKMWLFIWKKLNPLHQRMFCTKFVGIGCEVLQKKIFKCYQWFFAICYHLPWKRGWPFISTTLNDLHPRMLHGKFGWNWLSSSGKEDENVKSLQTDRWMEDIWRTTDKKSSLELRWAKYWALFVNKHSFND